jgi:hypothetical protein
VQLLCGTEDVAAQAVRNHHVVADGDAIHLGVILVRRQKTGGRMTAFFYSSSFLLLPT